MIKYFKVVLLSITLIFIPMLSGAEKTVARSQSDISLKFEIENAIGKGLTWLAGQQNNDGWWSQNEQPALTALVLTAFQGDPSGYYKKKYDQTINKGYSFVLKSVKPDGGIYEQGLANYNTSVAIMSLLLANRPEYEGTIKDARNFLIGLQHNEGEEGMGDSAMDGGVGYGGRYKHSDLSNTVFALEAIYYTRHLRNEKGENYTEKDLNWEAALQFISRTQNLPEYNDQKWASGDPGNKGGFVYFPGDSKAGEETLPDGKVALRSYGSMSYAGLLSYIYAQMDKDDPRIKAVYEWLTVNYTLDENPGVGQEGLYYYYQMMAKALSIYGIDTIKMKDGSVVDWRKALSERLINNQNNDGFWVNENGRWWEKDPVLVTSYSLIVMEIIWRGL